MQPTRIAIIVALISALAPLSLADAQFFDFGVPGEFEAPVSDFFGGSIAIDGDYTLIAGPPRFGRSGEVFIYNRFGDRVQILRAPGGAASNEFGVSMDVQPGRLIVGAPGEETAYVYARVSGRYNLVGTLTPSEATEDFGRQVALFGFNAWVSAPETDTGGVTNTGIVYHFQSNVLGAWHEEAQIEGPGNREAQFGRGMAYAGRLFIGAPGAGIGLLKNGLVYVYSSGGTLLDTIAPGSDVQERLGGARFGFGGMLAAEGDRLVARAPGDASELSNGIVLVYDHDGAAWTESQRIRRPREVGEGRITFGWDIAFSGTTLLVHSLQNIDSMLYSTVFTYHHNAVEWRDAGSIAAPVLQFRSMAIDGLRVLLGSSEDIVYDYTFTLEADTDDDRIRDSEDDDDDNDGVVDVDDSDPLDPMVCRDSDGDSCDDCSIGTDGFGPITDSDPLMDGTDDDEDGVCNASDLCVGDDALGDPDGNGICGDMSDAGVDGGASTDAGPETDAGSLDAGTSDAGISDAGMSDAGMSDAGIGAPDGGSADSGSATPPDENSGCSVGGNASPTWLLLIVAFVLTGRRRTRF